MQSVKFSFTACGDVIFCLVALSDPVAKESCMLNLLLSLPEPNLVTFLFLLDHLKR